MPGPSSITDMLGVGKLRAHKMQEVRLDEEGNAVMRIVKASSHFTTVRETFHHRQGPFSQDMSRSGRVLMAWEQSLSLMYVDKSGERPKSFRFHLLLYVEWPPLSLEKLFDRYLRRQALSSARPSLKRIRISQLASSPCVRSMTCLFRSCFT